MKWHPEIRWCLSRCRLTDDKAHVVSPGTQRRRHAMASEIEDGSDAATSDNVDKKEYETNVIVMSKAGKPIFSRFFGDNEEQEVVKVCGMIAAIRTSLVDQDMFGLGDLDSMKSNDWMVVFMSVGSITLIAMSKRGENGGYETEAYLRLQLEYIYGQIIFTLTEQVQNVFEDNPGFDLGNMLGSTDSVIHGILDEAGAFGNCASFFTSGVETIFPMDSKLREEASLALSTVGNVTPNTVFAILLVDNKLLTMVQPHYQPHQIQTSDLHLVVNFVKHQPGLLTSELWVPMCLPRFNSTGFLYAYTNCLHVDTRLSLVLLSQHNTTEQFEHFRRASRIVRKELGLPATVGSVLRILESNNQDEQEHQGAAKDDVAWKRSDVSIEEQSSDEDYVNVSAEIGQMAPSSGQSTEDAGHDSACPLLRQLEIAANPTMREELLEDYCNISSAIHFVFRIDVPIVTRSRSKSRRKNNAATKTPPSTLTQCISTPLDFPFVTPASKRHAWAVYQKMNLRLRLGAATPEATMEAFDTIVVDQEDNVASGKGSILSGIDRQCPAMCLAATLPDVDGITYVKDGGELFVGLSGTDFELYMALPGTIPPQEGAALGAKLIRTIRADEQKLFLMKPLTWKT